MKEKYGITIIWNDHNRSRVTVDVVGHEFHHESPERFSVTYPDGTVEHYNWSNIFSVKFKRVVSQ